MKMQTDFLRESIRELRSELKDLHKKVDAKGDKTDAKVDRLLYFFIGGILLKGGVDFYMTKEVQAEFEQKIISIVEKK